MAYLNKNSEIPTKGKGSKLSGKMLAFVDEYFIDLNATAAVLRAGYTASNPNRVGTELLNHPLVSAEIKRREEERKDKLELNAEFVINKLINIVSRTEVSNPGAAIRSLELLGKTLAMFKERQEISGPDGGAIETEQRIKRDVADFTSTISRLARRSGEETVVEFPKRQGDS